MAEECVKCSMAFEIKHIQEEMQERKENEKETRRDVAEIKAIQEKTIFVTEQIQKTQESQAQTAEKNQLALAIATKEYQVETARINKENQAENIRLNKEQSSKMEKYFKAIEDKRVADENKAIEEKKAIEIEKRRIKDAKVIEDKRLQELADARDLVLRAERRAQTRQIVMIGLGILAAILASTGYGLLKAYFPHVVGL